MLVFVLEYMQDCAKFKTGLFLPIPFGKTFFYRKIFSTLVKKTYVSKRN